eukprot:210111_1
MKKSQLAGFFATKKTRVKSFAGGDDNVGKLKTLILSEIAPLNSLSGCPSVIRNKIFGFLGFSDLISIRRVAKLLEPAINHALGNLDEIWAGEDEAMQESCRKLASRGKFANLRKFEFDRDFGMPYCYEHEVLCEALLENCPKLEMLSQVSCRAVLKQSAPLKNLRFTRFNFLDMRTNLDFVRLARQLPALNYIDLMYSRWDVRYLEEGVNAFFEAGCRQLASLILYVPSPPSVFRSVGYLPNLLYLDICMRPIDPSMFEAFLEHLPPRLVSLSVEIDDRCPEPALIRFVEHLSNVWLFNLSLDCGGSCSFVQDNPDTGFTRPDGLTGIYKVSIDTDGGFALRLLNLIAKSPLLVVGKLAMHMFSKQKNFYRNIPALPNCFPNVYKLSFNDDPNHLKRHLDFSQLSCLRMTRRHTDDAAPFKKSIAARILSVARLVANVTTLECLLEHDVSIGVIELKPIAWSFKKDNLLQKFLKRSWPKVKKLEFKVYDSENEFVRKGLKDIVSAMPALQTIETTLNSGYNGANTEIINISDLHLNECRETVG